MVGTKGSSKASEAGPGHGEFAGTQAKRLGHLTSMQMILLFILMRRSGSMAQRRLFDLSDNEWRIMTQLGGFAPLSLNGLAERLIQDRGQLSRAVKGLVERGLVTQARKPGGPELEITLTSEGQDLHAKMVEWVTQRDRALTEGIDADELAITKNVVERMIVHAREIVEQERELAQK